MGKYASLDPLADMRRGLVRALLWSVGCTLVVSLSVAVGWGLWAAIATLVGSGVVLVPNGWVVLRSATTDGHRMAPQLALVKFALCGLGFALLFALWPEVEAPAVFLGAMVALVALPISTALTQHRVQRQI